MLVPLSIAPSSIEDASIGIGALRAKALHRASAETILKFAYVAMATTPDVRDLVNEIRSSAVLDQASRNLWIEVFVELRKQRRLKVASPELFRGIGELTADEIAREWHGSDRPEVAVVAENRLIELYPDADGPVSDRACAICFVTMPLLIEAEPLVKARLLADAGRLHHGENRETFWTDVLGRLIAPAQSVAIFDRYLLGELARRAGSSGGTQRAPEALMWMLDRIHASVGSPVTVSLYGESGNGSRQVPNADAGIQLIQNVWQPSLGGRIAEVRLFVAPWSRKGRTVLPHDRHIRFSPSQAMLVPAGFDRLKAPVVTDSAGMAWTYLWTGPAIRPLRDSEISVERAVGVSTKEWQL